MGVLIVTPSWFRPSELWMTRQVELLEPDVVAIAAPDPTEDTWNGRIPAIPLRNGRVPLWRRAAPHLGLAVSPTPVRTAAQVLAEAVAAPTVSAVLIHYLNFAVGYESVWAGTDKPVFVHCHGYDFNLDCRRHDSPEQLFFKPVYRERARRVCQRCTIIANSEHSARTLRAEFEPPDLRVKYLGVPVPEQCPPRVGHTGTLEVLYVGRLYDFKGPDLTIRAFERACELGFDGRLTLAGDGELRVMCELLRRRSPVGDRIRLTGVVDAAAAEELRHTADIFTMHNCFGPLTHETEAYGVTVIEAMAAGLPVITGRCGGVCETIVDHETGFLVEPGNIEEHAQALVRLGRDPALRQRMGQAGWQRARNHFSVQQERATFRHHLGLATLPDDEPYLRCATEHGHDVSVPPAPVAPDRQPTARAVPTPALVEP